MNYYNSLDASTKNWVMIISIALITFILARVLRWAINKSYHKVAGRTKADLTRIGFFKNALTFILWMVAFGAMISFAPKLKAVAITLFAGAGILVAIIGFAAQEAFSNIISGIFIVIFRPFRVGDMIKVGDRSYGFVEDITLRHTVILNFEHKRVIIPNSVISSDTIVNDSIEDTFICKFIEVGISYDSDVDLACSIIQKAAINHPSCIDRRTKAEMDTEDQVEVRVLSFGDFSVNLRAYVWTDDPNLSFRMHSDINREIKKQFDLQGIEIPFPHRTLVFKDKDALQKLKST